MESIQLFALLHTVYCAPYRHYHGIQHINFLHAKVREWALAQLDELENDQISEAEQIGGLISRVDTAIWWHDFEYNIWGRPGANERDSAHAYKVALGREYDPVVADAILATAYHLEDQTIPDTDDGMVVKLMLDVDLVGFAEPMAAVRINSANVLKEYEPLGLPHTTLLENRVKFLDKLLERRRIFYTDYFYDKYEQVARENIQSSIEETKKELAGNV